MCQYAIHIASLCIVLLRTGTKYEMATMFGLIYENWSWRKMKVGEFFMRNSTLRLPNNQETASAGNITIFDQGGVLHIST